MRSNGAERSACTSENLLRVRWPSRTSCWTLFRRSQSSPFSACGSRKKSTAKPAAIRARSNAAAWRVVAATRSECTAPVGDNRGGEANLRRARGAGGGLARGDRGRARVRAARSGDVEAVGLGALPLDRPGRLLARRAVPGAGGLLRGEHRLVPRLSVARPARAR